MIAVTAPGGNVGRVLVSLLQQGGHRARLLTRPGAADSVPPGMEAAPTDLDDDASVRAALAGTERLFLLSPGPDTPAQDRRAIEAAFEAGVRHVVLLSSIGVEAGGIGGGTAHAPGEEGLRRTDLDWTVLRPNEFMTNTLMWLGEAGSAGTISLPTGSGRVRYVAPADIAAVALAALTGEGHVGRTYRLSGPEALSAADLAERIGGALGRPVTDRPTTVDEFRAAAAAVGVPPAVVDTLAAYYPGVAEGRMDLPSTDIADVTGRPATTYASFLRTTLAAQS